MEIQFKETNDTSSIPVVTYFTRRLKIGGAVPAQFTQIKSFLQPHPDGSYIFGFWSGSGGVSMFICGEQRDV